MKKYIFSLLSALVISSLLVAGYGAHIKYDILKPIGQYQDKSIMELPFLMYSDDALIYILEKQKAAEGPFMQTMPGENVPENGVIVRQTQPEEPSEPPEPVMPTEPEPVDESWFDDALFIGNSLTVGLREFGNFGDAEFFCDVGLTIFSAPKNYVYDTAGRHVNLVQVLEREKFRKIYIALGINECAYERDYFLSGYQDLVDLVRSYQPDAVIIFHGLITTGRSKAAQAPCWTPENIYHYNEGLRMLSLKNRNTRFIDFNPFIADEYGYLPEGWSWDGCHPNLEGYLQWADWVVWNAAYLDIPELGPSEFDAEVFQ